MITKMECLVVGLSLGVPGLFLFAIVIYVLMQRIASGSRGFRDCNLWWRVKEEVPIPLEGMPTRFRFEELSVATHGFSEESKLGQGGFGNVYRGVLPSGMAVAVKKIRDDATQGEKEFMAELSVTSRLRHRHLIQLLGWGGDVSRGQYLLVYELMANGSLDKALFERSADSHLSWQQRLKILSGVAAAIEYLHQGWTQKVIHRDIKCSNVMLDVDWNAKLGDFGLARLVDHEKTGATTLVAGTYGYIAPEIALYGKFTEKSDVFAFGAVILEIACGRKAFLSNAPAEERILVDLVWRSNSEGEILRNVDKYLSGYDPVWMQSVLALGLLCSHPDAMERPSMKVVVKVLAGDSLPFVPTSKPPFVFGSDPQGSSTYHRSTSTSEEVIA